MVSDAEVLFGYVEDIRGVLAAAWVKVDEDIVTTLTPELALDHVRPLLVAVEDAKFDCIVSMRPGDAGEPELVETLQDHPDRALFWRFLVTS